MMEKRLLLIILTCWVLLSFLVHSSIVFLDICRFLNSTQEAVAEPNGTGRGKRPPRKERKKSTTPSILSLSLNASMLKA